MFSVDLTTRPGDGYVVVDLRGELDVADAAAVAAAIAAVAVREPQIIVDLAALEFIDSSGVAALGHGRRQARRAGGDLLLAAPKPGVLRTLTAIRLVDAFSVHASVAEAARARLAQAGAEPAAPARISRLRLVRNATRSAIRPSASGSGSARPQAGQAEA